MDGRTASVLFEWIGCYPSVRQRQLHRLGKPTIRFAYWYRPSPRAIMYLQVQFETEFWRLMHSYTLHNTKYGVSCYDNSTHGYLSPCNINQLRVFNNADRCWWRKLLRISPPLVVDDYDATGRCSTGSQSTLDSTTASPVVGKTTIIQNQVLLGF